MVRGVLWAGFGLLLTVAVFFASWRLLAAFDFAYPVFYDLLAIGQTIERYGPENPVRPGFQWTTRAERERLFGEIVEAVRHGGRGLEGLRYHAPDGRVLGQLLTAAEIQHLNDVARLITWFERLGWLALAALVAATAVLAVRRAPPPPLRSMGLAGAGIAIGAIAIVFVLGPVDVFYWFHERIFPAGHQWFFWYEESLMSMMMKAPDLFGAIATLWLLTAALMMVPALWGIRHVLAARWNRRGGSASRIHPA